MVGIGQDPDVNDCDNPAEELGVLFRLFELSDLYLKITGSETDFILLLFLISSTVGIENAIIFHNGTYATPMASR